jgi:hypothetical protein
MVEGEPASKSRAFRRMQGNEEDPHGDALLWFHVALKVPIEILVILYSNPAADALFRNFKQVACRVLGEVVQVGQNMLLASKIV